MKHEFLILEPVGTHYRIRTKDFDQILLFEDYLPIVQMEYIKDKLEDAFQQVYCLGYKEGHQRGYDDGWTDSARDDFDK